MHRSMTTDNGTAYDDLLTFLYRSPVALLRITGTGDILMLTPRATSLLMGFTTEVKLDNIFRVLDPVTKEIHRLISAFTDDSGMVCESLPVIMGGGTGTRGHGVVEFTIQKNHPHELLIVMTDITAHKVNERELRHARYHATFSQKALLTEQHRLENILKATDAGVWEWNIETGNVVINDRIATMLGHTLAELSPVTISTLHALIHPEDLVVARANLGRHFADHEKHFTVEMRLKHSCGQWVWVRDSGRVTVWGEDGRALIMHGTMLDITEHKHTEITMQRMHDETLKTNTVLNDILESMSDWYWEVDAAGRYTYCSPRVEQQLGYSPAEMLGKHPFDFMPPEEVPVISGKFREIVQQKERIVDLMNWNITKAGKRVLHSTTGVPIMDDEGNLKGYRGVDKDVTELHTSTAELLKLSQAVQQSTVSTVITDTQGIIEYINPKFTNVTGYSAEEVIGRHIRLVKSDQTAPHTYKKLWATILQGKTWEGDFVNKNKSGQLYHEYA